MAARPSFSVGDRVVLKPPMPQRADHVGIVVAIGDDEVQDAMGRAGSTHGAEHMCAPCAGTRRLGPRRLVNAMSANVAGRLFGPTMPLRPESRCAQHRAPSHRGPYDRRPYKGALLVQRDPLPIGLRRTSRTAARPTDRSAPKGVTDDGA